MSSFSVLALSVFFLIVQSGSLASNVVPKSYDVQFNTDIKSGSSEYDGSVEICFNVTEEVGQLELHARNLTIKEVTLTNKEVDYATQSSELPNGNLLLKTDNPLPKGCYHLNITFSGTASDNDAMFKGSYNRDDGSVGHYLMSKPRKSDFNEGHSAFPHFGEELKATFKVSVAHDESLKAWSNMPLEKPSTPYDHHVLSSFQETPEMHVFDVGFFVSDFDSQKTGDLTVVARKDVLPRTQHVASVCSDLVKIMDNNHTAVEYSGPIPDYVLIALPHKLSQTNLTEFERMFVEEQAMTYDRAVDDFNKLAQFLKSAGNNVMLQWFGNWIAPDEDRLLQAFANVYTYFNAEKVYPQERMMMLYQVDVVQESLLRDYERPSSVLNMFWLIVLDEKWGAVMKNLSKNRQPRTVTSAQLCSEAQGLWKEDYNIPEGTTLEAIFNQWMGTDEDPPVLNVNRLYSEGKALLSQAGSKKVLPYNYATEYSHFAQLGPFQWLTGSNETVQFAVPDDHWLIVNKEQFGSYRVNYDERNWKLIIEALRSNASSIHRINRMQLLDDALNFVKNDQLDVSILLDLLTYLRNEMFYDVWYDAYNVLINWYHYELEPPKYVKDYFMHIIEPYYQSFASQEISDSTPQMELHLRAGIADLACWLGIKDCQQQARTRFQEAVTKNTTVEPNWSQVIYCFGLVGASDDELEWLLTKHSQQLPWLANILTCVGTEKQMRRVLVELKTKSNQGSIATFVEALDENAFEMLYSLLKNDPELVELLGSATLECALGRVSKSTKSAKTLKLIDDLEASLGLHIVRKGSGSTEKNIWAKPGAAEFIERYMAKVDGSR